MVASARDPVGEYAPPARCSRAGRRRRDVGRRTAAHAARERGRDHGAGGVRVAADVHVRRARMGSGLGRDVGAARGSRRAMVESLALLGERRIALDRLGSEHRHALAADALAQVLVERICGS